MELAHIGKYRGPSENRGLSENRDSSENKGLSDNGACLHRKLQGLSENKGLACIGKYRG